MDKSGKILSHTICLAGRIWAFSYSKSHVPDVIRYIQNQEAHHKKETFLAEYNRLLKAFEIEYDEQYIFKNPE